MLKLLQSVGLASSCSDATVSCEALMTDVTMGYCSIGWTPRCPSANSFTAVAITVLSYIHTLLALSGAPRGEGGKLPRL